METIEVAPYGRKSGGPVWSNLFTAASHFTLKTATGDKTSRADFSKGPFRQRPCRGQGRSVGFFRSSLYQLIQFIAKKKRKKKQLIQRNYPPAALSAKRFRASLSQSLARKTPFYPSSLHHTSSSRMKRVAVGQFLPFRAQFQPY